MELDRIFDQRRTSAISVGEVFMDRLPYLAAFDAAVELVRARPEPGATAPTQRANVLVFYGLGGIGKTALSRRLDDHFRRGLVPGAPERRISCQVDLDNRSLADLESLVISLRSALGGKLSSCPAFDLAFAVYWERARPGVPLRQMITQHSALGRVSESLSLPEQLDESLNALLGMVPLAGLARRATGLLVTAIRDRMRRDRLLADCPGFAELLGLESATEMLPFLPALLSWDLARSRAAEPLDAVVFLDTFERVTGLPREAGGLEDQIARLIYLMPNVLFVITGRNRLDWAERRHLAVHYSGPNYWPALPATGTPPYAPMQHWLHGLSGEDADGYLRLRLTLDGEPAIPADIRGVIVAASGGVPHYLELSAGYFDQIKAGGREPAEEDFGGTFGEVVVRVMRDLTGDERRLMRAASMLDRFDAGLLRSAVPGVQDAVIGRFLQHTMVQSDASRWLPYAVDDYMRAMVRRHDTDTADPWSDEEWRAAATRALSELSRRLRPAVEDPALTDRAQVVEGFVTSRLLTLDVDQVPGWLYDLAYALAVRHLASALAPGEEWVPPAGSAAEAFALTCQGMSERVVGNRRTAVGFLERAQRHPGGTGYARLFATHRLAKAYEELGRYRDAERMVAQVAAEPGPLRENAEKDLAWIQWLRGDGRRLHAWALPLLDSPLGIRRAQSLDLLGQFSLIQGDFATAERCFRVTLDDEELKAAGISRDTGWRHLGMVLAFPSPLEADGVLERAREVNQGVEHQVGVAQTYVWQAVARTGRAPAHEVLALIEQGERMLTASGGAADRWMVLIARAFLAAVDGLPDEARAAAETLIAHLAEEDCHPGLGQIAARWLAARDITVDAPAHEYWVDRTASLDRWERVLTDRRAARPGAA